MRAPTGSPSPLENTHIPVPLKLAAAWTSFMFLYIYVDYLALYQPGFIDDIRAGIVHEFENGPTFVSMALTLMAIPLLMILLSTTLPARADRTIDLVLAALYIPVSLCNVAGEPWNYFYFYGFSIGLEVLILAFILRFAWTWPRRIPSSLRRSRQSHKRLDQRTTPRVNQTLGSPHRRVATLHAPPRRPRKSAIP